MYGMRGGHAQQSDRGDIGHGMHVVYGRLLLDSGWGVDHRHVRGMSRQHL
jgi:hypothetical protein